MKDIISLIEKAHATPHKAVIVVAGAGTQALAWLLGVPGASRTVLETLVPYGRLSMIDFLSPRDSTPATLWVMNLLNLSHPRPPGTWLRPPTGGV